jgi:phosphatidate cytidylyltransferase
MWLNHSLVPLARLVTLFSVLLAAGMLLTLPLYRFDYRRFIKSKLFIKIIFWIPIFIIFVSLLYASNSVRLVVLLVLLGVALGELIRVLQRQKASLSIPLVYFLGFGIALMHFYAIGITYRAQAVNLLITICFASVLADVTAFFMGNYIGKHKLPTMLNKNKSWEGVAGQLIGAFIGVLLVNAFIVPVSPFLLFLPIGIGSAAGDLANSYVKRLVNTKDWSNNIPGHGGYLDRLSSLAGAAVLTFYFLKLAAPKYFV